MICVSLWLNSSRTRCVVAQNDIPNCIYRAALFLQFGNDQPTVEKYVPRQLHNNCSILGEKSAQEKQLESCVTNGCKVDVHTHTRPFKKCYLQITRLAKPPIIRPKNC